ncbi:predicted protein [Chaetomium globosum CBS 148.51]|uniref:Uncharacterized protein n=1 Tax=Chaetomium globosum (strain ATCC 6205 / CBS 148.51 / DSM 1962 / NBRC 6347 / NRRL 1970) TaxID=306901 RepID=Q2HG68_CHAGB|nr:uncharacterized protein CHGG_00786 [Chaetomium globosum CBS 148.51]EAQ92551.1 predicted protein [Chaetomium globosum CBS 148.51]
MSWHRMGQQWLASLRPASRTQQAAPARDKFGNVGEERFWCPCLNFFFLSKAASVLFLSGHRLLCATGQGWISKIARLGRT